jgi:hypothetical protein
MDLFDKLEGRPGPLGEFTSDGYGYYTFPKLEGPIGPEMKFNGKNVIVWSVNDYLSVGNHPHIREVDKQAAERYGFSNPMGARLMTGNSDEHEALERELADFTHKPQAMLLNYGYQGIMSVIHALVDRNDFLIYDELSHACIVAVRTYVRSLAGMQKEALVVSSAGGPGWRLVSDEGPYLAGHDEAPFPLAFFNAGIVASYLNEVVALAAQRSIAYDDLRLVVDNRYTMEGSAIKGTMRGGALPPEVRVEVATAAGPAEVRNLAADGLDASPLGGLLRGGHTSLFTLTHNGAPLDPERAAALDRSPLPDLGDRFDEVGVDGPDDAHSLMRILRPADATEGEGGKGSSLQAEQKRTLHVRGIGTIGADGVKDIDVQLFKPIGSNFRFRSAEPGAVVSSTATPRNRSHAGHNEGGAVRAPDAATLISAGVAFCFMTQFGRYAAITRKRLSRYRTIQDTHLSAGGASGGTGRAGEADPVETHVYLDTEEDDDFARTLLAIGEQTCFLHALCRTPLKPKLAISRAVDAQSGLPT